MYSLQSHKYLAVIIYVAAGTVFASSEFTKPRHAHIIARKGYFSCNLNSPTQLFMLENLDFLYALRLWTVFQLLSQELRSKSNLQYNLQLCFYLCYEELFTTRFIHFSLTEMSIFTLFSLV